MRKKAIRIINTKIDPDVCTGILVKKWEIEKGKSHRRMIKDPEFLIDKSHFPMNKSEIEKAVLIMERNNQYSLFCDFCKKEFQSKRPDAKYCCPSHKQAAYQKRKSNSI